MLIDKAEIGDVEVALVDGTVRVKEDEEKLIEARRKSRYLLAWGTCAAFGGIPAFANQYELEDLIKESFGQTKDAFAYYLSGTRGIDWATYQEQENELRLLRRASKLDEFVRVDYYLPGCPPRVDILVQFLNELKGEGEVSKPKTIVCSECSRKHVKIPTEHFWISPRPAVGFKSLFYVPGIDLHGVYYQGRVRRSLSARRASVLGLPRTLRGRPEKDAGRKQFR